MAHSHLCSLLANSAQPNIKIADSKFARCNSQMLSNERRIVPRKAYAMPARFDIIAPEFAAVGVRAKTSLPRGASKFLETIPLPQQGETVNLSELGFRFKTRHTLSVGESVELFFTLPAELTGRAIEDVKCNAESSARWIEKRTRRARSERMPRSSALSAHPWRARLG